MRTVLSIAGSDSCGGAGIQADIKTMTMYGVYAMSAVTAMTAQNTMGIKSVQESTPGFLAEQIDAVFEDIFPDAVKIGMVPSGELIGIVADRMRYYGAKNIVVDPVMTATSGASMMRPEAVKPLIGELFPVATLITPNIPEAEILSGWSIEDEEDMQKVAKTMGDEYGCNVLVKGGHRGSGANDVLYIAGEFLWFRGKRVDNSNCHGTGCTLSSAIAANLAKGLTLPEAVREAKNYVSGALAAMLNLGKGSGPLKHNFSLPPSFFRESKGKRKEG